MKTFGKTFDGQSGDFTLKPEVEKTYVYTPNQKGASEIRAVAPADADGNPIPQIETGATDLGGVSDQFVQCDYARFLGSLKYHMLCPVNEKLDDSIVGYFYRAIYKHFKEHKRTCPTRYYAWLGEADEGQKNAPRATLKAPSQHLLMQGYLIKHAGKPMTRDGKPRPLFPVVLMLSSSARKTMLDDMMTPLDPDAELSTANSKLGDVSSLTGNSIIVDSYEDPEAKGFSKLRYRVTAGKQMRISQKQNAIYRNWEEILNLNEPASVVLERLARAFDAEAVNYVFGNSPLAEDIPAEVRNAETSRTKTKPVVKKAKPKPVEPAGMDEPMEGIDDLLNSDDGPADPPFEADDENALSNAGLDYDMKDLEAQLEKAANKEGE